MFNERGENTPSSWKKRIALGLGAMGLAYLLNQDSTPFNPISCSQSRIGVQSQIFYLVDKFTVVRGFQTILLEPNTLNDSRPLRVISTDPTCDRTDISFRFDRKLDVVAVEGRIDVLGVGRTRFTGVGIDFDSTKGHSFHMEWQDTPDIIQMDNQPLVAAISPITP